jgi:hypothetical protein
MPSGVLLAGACIAALVALRAARRVHKLWTQDRAGMGDREVADNLRPVRTPSNYSVRVPPSPRHNSDRRGY